MKKMWALGLIILCLIFVGPYMLGFKITDCVAISAETIFNINAALYCVGVLTLCIAQPIASRFGSEAGVFMLLAGLAWIGIAILFSILSASAFSPLNTAIPCTRQFPVGQ